MTASHDPRISDFEVGLYSSARLRVRAKMRMPQKPERAFELWTNHLERIFEDLEQPQYFKEGQPVGDKVLPGVDQRRFLFGCKLVVEDIPAFEPGRYFAYQANHALSVLKTPISQHLGLLSFEPDERGTIVTMRQYYNYRFHPLARLVTWGFKKGAETMFERVIEVYGGEMLTAQG